MRPWGRKVLILSGMCLLLLACGPLQKARIRQEVTIDTHVEETAELSAGTTVLVLSLAQQEKTLSKTTLTANEAAADILSLELLNSGYTVIDRSVINDYMKEQKIELNNMDFTKILEMGRALRADCLILTNLFENLLASHAIAFLPGNVLTSIDTSANIGMSSRMIDLATGEVVWVGIATTQDQNFQKAVQRIVKKLIASLKYRERN